MAIAAGDMMPVVSVIIAAYNCRQTISRAIQSAQNQTLRDIEIIVADDSSTDGTFDYVQSLAASDPRIKCVRLPKNGGPGAARNACIEMAQGEWIAVLDADDWYEPQRLEELVKAAYAHQADVICDNLKIFDHARGEIVDQTLHGGRGVIPLTPDFFFRHDTPLHRHAIGYLKPLTKRAFLQQHNMTYNLQYRTGEDFLFLSECLLNGAKAFLVPDAYYVYVHRISPTTRKISPHSRSDAGFDLSVRGCDFLQQKYGHSMTPAARQALEHKRYVFDSRMKYNDMIAALKQKNVMGAAGIFMHRPVIAVLVAATLGKLAYANILAVMPQQKQKVSQ